MLIFNILDLFHNFLLQKYEVFNYYAIMPPKLRNCFVFYQTKRFSLSGKAL